MGGSICGGVISESQMMKGIKKNPYAYMMSYTLPDKQYKKWVELLKEKKDKEAHKIFEKYAYSAI